MEKNRILKKTITLNDFINNQNLKRVLLIEKKMYDYDYITKILAQGIPIRYYNIEI